MRFHRPGRAISLLVWRISDVVGNLRHGCFKSTREKTPQNHHYSRHARCYPTDGTLSVGCYLGRCQCRTGLGDDPGVDFGNGTVSPYLAPNNGWRNGTGLLLSSSSNRPGRGRSKERRVRRNRGSKMPVKLLVVDDHEVVRRGLYTLLKDSDIKISAEASSGEEAIELALKQKPDVVLMDIRLSDIDGLQALEMLKKKSPNAKVVILSTYDNP